MNQRSQVNGDNSGTHALTGGPGPTSTAAAASAPAPAAPKRPVPGDSVEPLKSLDWEDKNHGKGGQYRIVDGKRVRVDPSKKA